MRFGDMGLVWAYVIEALALQIPLAKTLANPSYANLGVMEGLANLYMRSQRHLIKYTPKNVVVEKSLRITQWIFCREPAVN